MLGLEDLVNIPQEWRHAPGQILQKLRHRKARVYASTFRRNLGSITARRANAAEKENREATAALYNEIEQGSFQQIRFYAFELESALIYRQPGFLVIGGGRSTYSQARLGNFLLNTQYGKKMQPRLRLLQSLGSRPSRTDRHRGRNGR